MLAALAGMAVAAVNIQRMVPVREEPGDEPEVPPGNPKRRRRLLRAAALLLLVALSVLAVHSAHELRGEMAYMRFLYFDRLAMESKEPADVDQAVAGANQEAVLVMQCAGNNPDALREVSGAMLQRATDRSEPSSIMCVSISLSTDHAFFWARSLSRACPKRHFRPTVQGSRFRGSRLKTGLIRLTRRVATC